MPRLDVKEAPLLICRCRPKWQACTSTHIGGPMGPLLGRDGLALCLTPAPRISRTRARGPPSLLAWLWWPGSAFLGPTDCNAWEGSSRPNASPGHGIHGRLKHASSSREGRPFPRAEAPSRSASLPPGHWRLMERSLNTCLAAACFKALRSGRLQLTWLVPSRTCASVPVCPAASRAAA